MSFFGRHIFWKKQRPIDYTTTQRRIEESGPKGLTPSTMNADHYNHWVCACLSHIYTLEGWAQNGGVGWVASIFQLSIHCISESINYSPALKYWYGNHHPHKWRPTYRQSVLPFTVSLSHLASLPRVLFMQLKRCPFNTFMLGFTVKEDYTITKIITLIFLNLFPVHLKSTSEYMLQFSPPISLKWIIMLV